MVKQTVRVEGLKELERALIDTLPAQVGFKVLRGSLFSASLPMVKAAEANATAIQDTGALAESIGRFSRKGRAGDRAVTVFIGPKTNDKKAIALANAAGRKIKGIFYGAMVEKGTRRSSPRPYLRPAFISTRDQVIERFSDILAKNIEKAAKKAYAKSPR